MGMVKARVSLDIETPRVKMNRSEGKDGKENGERQRGVEG